MKMHYSTTLRIALFSLLALALILPAHASEQPVMLEPAWELENADGILYIDSWSGCELLYANTFAGDIQAIDKQGAVRWSINPGMSWPDLAGMPDGTLWVCDGALAALVAGTGEVLFSYDTMTPGPLSGGPAIAAFTDIDTAAIHGIGAAGEGAWDVSGVAPDIRLLWQLPSAADAFIVEANDFSDARQEFIALGADGVVRWRFDATEYGVMPVAGLYPLLRADGSLLLAQVTSRGEIGGEYGEYGSLVSLSSAGELEWVYPQAAYLLSYYPAADGTVHVVLPDYTIHAVGRDGADRWVHAYDGEEHLRDCVTLPDGGALVCYGWWDEMPLSNATLRVERIGADGAVAAEYLLSRPRDVYWYMLPLDGLLVCLDGDTRLAAFELP